MTAGQQIGIVGVLGNGRGRSELQINYSSAQLAYCPARFGTQAFNAAFVAAANRVNGNSVICSAPAVIP